MDFQFTEEQKLLQETARDFANEVIAPKAAATDRDAVFPLEAMKKMAELGFTGMTIPEGYGGTELGNLALSIVLIEINRACASTGVTLSVHCSLASSPIVRFGSEAVKRKYLPRMASGEILGAYSLTEPGSGSDSAALRTRAVKDGAKYRLTGTKTWVTSGSHAGVIIVFARTSDEKKPHKGITAFLVEPSFKGIAIGKHEEKMGIRGSTSVELVLDGCEVPEENVLGDVGEGFRVAMDTLDGGRIGIASQAVGISDACLEASVKYAKEREQFGQPIAEFEAIQWKIADMATRIEASRLLTFHAAAMRDRKEPCSHASAMAKLMASTTANFCAREAVQIHGGAGYTVDFPVERYMRDARITELYEGTTEIQRIVVARQYLRG